MRDAQARILEASEGASCSIFRCCCVTSHMGVALYWFNTAGWPACVPWFGGNIISILHRERGNVLHSIGGGWSSSLFSRGSSSPNFDQGGRRTHSVSALLFVWASTATQEIT